MDIELQLNTIVSSINEIKNKMATKEDLEGMATKEDLEGMATKEDLKGMATKKDLERMATKEELKVLESKMATKEDIRLIRRDMRKMNLGIEAILEDIKMLDDRTRPMVKIKNS